MSRNLNCKIKLALADIESARERFDTIVDLLSRSEEHSTEEAIRHARLGMKDLSDLMERVAEIRKGIREISEELKEIVKESDL